MTTHLRPSAQKVLVLGGTGFLGAQVARVFTERGYVVEGCSRATGVDARQAPELLAFVEDCSPDIMVNCAHHGGGIAYNAQHPVEIFEDNLLTGFNAVRCAAQAGVQKFVNIMGNSTYPAAAEIYREREWWNSALHASVMASAMPRKAHWVQAWAYGGESRLCSIHLVLPNMYGPGDHFDPRRSHALAALLRKIWQAKQGGCRQVEVWGTGEAVREWLYVEDAAQGIALATERYDGIDIMNLGSGTGCTIRELAELIRELLDWDGEFVFDRSRPDGAHSKIMDITRMRELLDWTPPTSLRQGIRNTIAWFLEHQAMAVAQG